MVHCESTVKHDVSTMEHVTPKCSTLHLSEHCEKRVEHCETTEEPCDTTEEHCDFTVEHCDITVVQCDSTVEHAVYPL